MLTVVLAMGSAKCARCTPTTPGVVVQGKYSTLTLGQLCNVVYCGMFLSQMSCSVVHSNCQELCKIKMKRY